MSNNNAGTTLHIALSYSYTLQIAYACEVLEYIASYLYNYIYRVGVNVPIILGII